MTIQKDGTDKNGNYDMLARHVKNKNLNTNKKILPMLEHNVKHFTNCTVYKNALGSAEAKVSMAYESHSGTNHITDYNGDIVMKTLDSFGFTDVDIIKIDVEGYEIEHKKDIFDLLSSWGMRRCEKKWPDQIWSF